jgi:hypothetical protein
MKPRVAYVVVLFLCWGTKGAFASERSTAAKRVEELGKALRTRYQSLELARGILKATPSNTKSFSDEQMEAISLVGESKDASAIDDLLRVIIVRHEHEVEPLVWEPPSTRHRPPDPFEEYPAAAALRGIGYPTVGAICRIVHQSRGKVDPQRLQMYGELLGAILGHHTVSYLKVERARAPKSAIPVFDRLLEMPCVKNRTETAVYAEPE